VEEFVFEVDVRTGKTTGVEPKALRTGLERKK
jgi:hypothetical protein